MKASLVRTRVPVLAAVAASALLLSACGGEPQSTATGGSSSADLSCHDTPSGGAVDDVSVSGEFGAMPTVEFESGLSTDETVRKSVIEGAGAEVKPGDMVMADLTIYNGRTGEVVSQTPYSGSGMGPLDVDENEFITGLVRTLECVPEGSRVVSVVSSADGFGEQGSSDGAVLDGDSLVVIADILRIVPSVATGAEQPQPDGYPTVELDDEGVPTVTIPDAEPPAELQLAVLKQGDGEKVQDGDTVTVQYQGVNWRTGEVFDQSWGTGVAQFATNAVIPGFTAALVDHEVGSQVLAVIPPDQGYGEAGEPDAGIEGTDTLVFVVDILATSR
ncbi:FKBP-type peptidyl-prolyl cis-trans isomerase [Okibacterium endophyticum]